MLDGASLSLINGLVNDMEIKNIVFSMKPLKAPRDDGLNAIFYQSQWSVVGPSICHVVKEVFRNGTLHVKINRILLVLVLKNDNLLSLTIYHHISLCNVVYKTVTKMIGNRLTNYSPPLNWPTANKFFSRQTYY